MYWRLFSLFLAVIFWLLAAGDGSFGGTERIVTLQVAIHNLPSNLVVVERPESVQARITGLSPFLNKSGEALNAHVDLKGALGGKQLYAVEVAAPVGIEVLSVTPRWVRIETEQLVSKTFPVTLAVLGMDPGRSLSAIKPNPDTVTVTGRGSILESVDLAVAYLSLNGEAARLEGAFPVQVLDRRGQNVGGVTVEPAQVSIEVEVDGAERGDEPDAGRTD